MRRGSANSCSMTQLSWYSSALVAIGRKNYLHVGSDAGGHTAAVMYTLLGTAKLNGINPQRYLRYVLECLADHPSNRIDELLPWVVAARWADDASAKDMPLAA